jgi:hypothetical protein
MVHAWEEHEIVASEVIDHNVYGRESWECDIEECYDGICPGCGEFTDSIKVCSPIIRDGTIDAYLVRCLNCKSLSITYDIESFLPIVNTDEPIKANKTNKSCLQCKHMTFNNSMGTYICTSYASEVYIGRNSLGIAQTCEDFELKEDKEK